MPVGMVIGDNWSHTEGRL